MSETTLYNDDCLNVLKNMKDNSVNMLITSPPYYHLRDYGSSLGLEESVDDYISNLILIFDEVYRVLTKDGSCWVNIDDTYYNKGLLCVPDKFKIKMIEHGWICRNEIIWHKPNAMPCSCKDRFNNDYEKFFFFVKNQDYKFHTQYEPCLSIPNYNSNSNLNSINKYKDVKQESSVRQGMNKTRGSNIVKLRKNLPKKEEFIQFIKQISKHELYNFCSKTTVDHWFRNDCGFSYPTVEDWNKVKKLYSKFQDYFKIDKGLTDITYETDSITKNIDKGRIKRSVWSINTKPSPYEHYAIFPTELIETPIKACTDKNDVVMDCFMGSGTVGDVACKLDRNFIGCELNFEYFKIAEDRINKAKESIFEL